MDRVWDTSEYPPKSFVALYQVNVIQCHEVKKIKFKIIGSGGVIRVFRSDLRQERKK